MEGSFRQTAEMSSRRLAALEFIKRHIAQRGKAPSLAELAKVLDTNKSRVSDILDKLAEAGDIIRIAGKERGIELPKSIDAISIGDALARLRAEGWTVNSDILGLPDALSAAVVTNTELFAPAELDHIPDVESGGNHADGTGGDGKQHSG